MLDKSYRKVRKKCLAVSFLATEVVEFFYYVSWGISLYLIYISKYPFQRKGEASQEARRVR